MRNIYELSSTERELTELAERYNSINSYRELSLIKEDIYRFEYGRGGKKFHRGYYCPGLFDRYNRGERHNLGRLSAPGEDYTHEYGFDISGSLIYAAYLDETEEYISGGDVRVGAEYHSFYKTLLRVTRCIYSGGRLMSVETGYAPMGDVSRMQFDIENYTYKDGVLQSIETASKGLPYAPRYHTLYSVRDGELEFIRQWQTK